MRLKDCTKEELIFVIERLQFYSLSGDYYVQRALRDVAEQREDRKLEETRRLTDVMLQNLQQYNELLGPYEGKSFADIPQDVMDRAVAALERYEAADKKWLKLMGFPTDPPAGKKRRAVSSG